MSRYALGWLPELAMQRRAERYARGGYAVVDFQDDRPLPPAMSLAVFRKWPFDQGNAGTCYANAGTQAFQIHTAADANFFAYPLARRFVAYWAVAPQGRNPADGGTISDVYDVMSHKGVAKEESWPYTTDRADLAQKPPAAVSEGAKVNHVSEVAEFPIGDDWRRAIFNGHPVTIGIWWPDGWDTRVNAKGQVTGIGPGGYGHALAVIGWVNDWDGKDWFQIENSHGPIYHPVPADVAARIPGYLPATPEQTFDFWAPKELVLQVIGKGNAECITAAGLTGFVKREQVWSIADDMMGIWGGG